jgi:hypothetical protein
MTFRETYRKQVSLLVRILPLIAEEPCFALVARRRQRIRRIGKMSP